MQHEIFETNSTALNNPDKIIPDVTEKKEYERPVLEEKPLGKPDEEKQRIHLLQQKYKKECGEAYLVQIIINQDDEEEKTYRFVFKKPSVPSYDRYVKTSSTSPTRALKTFVLDNICDEQKNLLESTLENLPAMAISLGEKLLNMLGLSKETTVKKL